MRSVKTPRNPIYVTTIVDEAQREYLKLIAYQKRKPMAEIIREALQRYIFEELLPAKRKKSA